jgi:hypothetical protein
MVAVVQLVERQIVILVVVGSSPIGHPIKKIPCLAKRRAFLFPQTLNQKTDGARRKKCTFVESASGRLDEWRSDRKSRRTPPGRELSERMRRKFEEPHRSPHFLHTNFEKFDDEQFLSNHQELP